MLVARKNKTELNGADRKILCYRLATISFLLVQVSCACTLVRIDLETVLELLVLSEVLLQSALFLVIIFSY